MLFLSTLVSCLPLALAANIYVAPTGNPTPDGSSAKPFGDIQAAINITQPGDVVILRGGTYELLKNINITVNGTAQAPITLRAATDEVVIIDGEGLPNTPAPVGASIPGKERGVLHVERIHYWNFQRLTFTHGPYGVYVKDSSNLRFNQIVTRDNYESGFHMQGALSNNVISCLDSYGNRDPRNNGENADGIAIKEGKGEGNIIVGSRFWDNSDDRVDFWRGVQDLPDFTGNGNGFKLGGGSAGDILPAGRDVVNCIAFGNKANGFTDNSQTGEFLFEENTSVWNGAVGFRSVNATGVLERNIAAVNRPGSPTNVTYGGQVTLRGAQISGDNSWDNSASLLTNASFKSIDIGLVTGARNKNGKIAASDFLLPVDGAERALVSILSSTMKSIGIFPGSGGLGGSTYEYLRKLLPNDQIILINRYPQKIPQEHLEHGVRVRKASYESSPSDLEAAFAGIEVFFLISYPSHVHDYRRKEFRQVQLPAIDAARRAGIKHIFYSSLAFGGDYQDTSIAEVMQAHLDSERHLTEAAASDPSFTFTSIREGLYSESSSYPTTGVAWVKRNELGEATARLIANYSWDPDQFAYVNKKILLTGSREWSLEETVQVLGQVAGKDVRIRQVDVDEYVKLPQVVARFGSQEKARTWATAWDAIRAGETAVVTSHMKDIIGREPEAFDVTIAQLRQS
ncbi:hypothetical protein COL922a_012879 [Colletotrichum nupharicola]|nr:hypothetical protein COL922a_012879 [Colletotrichum nupharicola]